MKKTSGFTLIELIVVIAVILVISITTLLNYNSYTDKQRVKQAGLTLRSDLRLTQTKAISGQKPFVCDEMTTLQGYTVAFSTTCENGGCYTIQPLCVASSGIVDTSSELTTVYLPSGINFDHSYSPVTFSAVTGVTDLTSNLSLVLTGAGVTYTVTVTPSGSVSDY